MHMQAVTGRAIPTLYNAVAVIQSDHIITRTLISLGNSSARARQVIRSDPTTMAGSNQAAAVVLVSLLTVAAATAAGALTLCLRWTRAGRSLRRAARTASRLLSAARRSRTPSSTASAATRATFPAASTPTGS
jgi:hypothetical protein